MTLTAAWMLRQLASDHSVPRRRVTALEAHQDWLSDLICTGVAPALPEPQARRPWLVAALLLYGEGREVRVTSLAGVRTASFQAPWDPDLSVGASVMPGGRIRAVLIGSGAVCQALRTHTSSAVTPLTGDVLACLEREADALEGSELWTWLTLPDLEFRRRLAARIH